MEFDSLEALYERLRPAFRCKINEFKVLGIKNISECDIWNYLKKTKWQRAQNLTLAEMVSDILKVDLNDIEKKCIEN